MNVQNDEVFQLYKPLRNKIRKYNLLESLYVIWAYSRNYTFNHSFPSDIELPAGFNQNSELFTRKYNGLQEFEMEFLVREFVLNCNHIKSQKSIRNKHELGKIVNYLRSELDNGLVQYFSSGGDILLESHRWSHRQFKWQHRYDRVELLRYFKIFSSPDVDELIKKTTNLSVREIQLIGFYLFSTSASNFAQTLPIYSNVPEMSTEKFSAFISLFGSSIEDLRAEMKETYRMDETILYSYNPIVARPLIIYNQQLICPLHLLLFWQVTRGLYYFIINETNFNRSFGDSFENYVGEVINDNLSNSKSSLIKEFIYGKEHRKTSDWILVNSSSITFVECKSKRMTQSAKSEIGVSGGLESDLDKLATFVVQIYKTYIDYKNDRYEELTYNKDLHFLPVLVTLEDWYTNQNVKLPGMIDEKVRNKLSNLNIDESIVDEFPYHIMSVDDFEHDIQIIVSLGAERFSKLHAYKQYLNFKKEFKYKEIFKGQFEELFIEPLKEMKNRE